MNAASVGKTIIVWDKLSDEDINRFIHAIEDIIENYRKYITEDVEIKAIPIFLNCPGKYVSVIKKNNEVVVSTAKNKNGEYDCVPILNADDMYKYIGYLEDNESSIRRNIHVMQKYPDKRWFDSKYGQVVNHYLLTASMNPESFIKALCENKLSDYQRQYFEKVGISLSEKSYSKQIKETVEEANKLFEDR